jgi:hypothetical protein
MKARTVVFWIEQVFIFVQPHPRYRVCVPIAPDHEMIVVCQPSSKRKAEPGGGGDGGSGVDVSVASE